MKNLFSMIGVLAMVILLASCDSSTPQSPLVVAQANLDYGQPPVVAVAVGDVTGDGKKDIVFGDKDGIKLLVNTGHGRFASPVVISNASLGYGQPSVAIGDVTGDGLADVIFGDKNGVTVLKSLRGNKFEILR